VKSDLLRDSLFDLFGYVDPESVSSAEGKDVEYRRWVLINHIDLRVEHFDTLNGASNLRNLTLSLFKDLFALCLVFGVTRFSAPICC